MTLVSDDRPPQEPPPDFDTFWSATLAELDEIPARVAEHSERREDGGDVVDLAFDSLGGARIGGYVARAIGDGPRPLVVHGHGYTSPGVEVCRRWFGAGLDVCGIDVRGYGRSTAALPDPSDAGYLLTGAESPETSVLRGAVCDYLRAVEVAEARCGPASRVILQGTSFAGGLATMAEALRPRADLLVLRVPSLAWHAGRARLATLGSGRELSNFTRAHPERAKQTRRTLAYFDALHFAGRVRCPALVGVGERDEVVPASTVLALYERLGGPRELERFPVSHSHSPLEERWLEFDARWLELAVDGLPARFGRPRGAPVAS